jgi:hypothetical protein
MRVWLDTVCNKCILNNANEYSIRTVYVTNAGTYTCFNRPSA